MSARAANLELVRSIYAAWERGDYTSAEWADPEVEFVIADGPAPEGWRGRRGLVEGTRAWIDVWEGMSVRAEQCLVLDEERVLVLTRYRGRAKTSGFELGRIGAAGASVFYVRDGKVIRYVAWFDRDRALAELGVAPEG